MSGRVTYMNVPAVRGEKEESFEERRVLDYVQAYRTTGRPPLPCPQLPTDPQQRAALGYPPLFEPFSETAEAAAALLAVPPVLNGLASANARTPPNFAAQAFHPTKLQEYGTEAYFHTIVAQPGYTAYSVEELRVEAYRMGKKVSDVPLAPVVPPPLRPALLPSIALSSSSQSSSDSMQSINSAPPYEQHSFEELRLAYLRAGRPLTSPEIVVQNVTLRLTV